MLTQKELQQLRVAFRSELARLTSATDAAKRVIDEIIDHPRFAGATDPPVLATLQTMLRVMQPRHVLEIGTYIGMSTVFIADTLAQNPESGRLWTVDPDVTAHDLARGWINAAHLRDFVSFVEGCSTDPNVVDLLSEVGPFELIYLDSSHAYRSTIAELELIFDAAGWLAVMGLLVLHDASASARHWDPTGEGGVRRALDEWIDEHRRDAQLLILEPPLWPAATGLAFVTRRGIAGDADSATS